MNDLPVNAVATAEFSFHELRGDELRPWMEALGQLRMRVFREYPYLYDGTAEYEREYLRIYLECPDSLVVLATTACGELVGATTCMPLAAECTEFRQPFLRENLDVGEYLYLGESIVLPEFRGRGLGREFFARREAQARLLGMAKTAFCAVNRDAGHPLRPATYRELDAYWAALGYLRQPHLQAEFCWKEINESCETRKTMTFWIKETDPQSGGK